MPSFSPTGPFFNDLITRLLPSCAHICQILYMLPQPKVHSFYQKWAMKGHLTCMRSSQSMMKGGDLAMLFNIYMWAMGLGHEARGGWTPVEHLVENSNTTCIQHEFQWEVSDMIYILLLLSKIIILIYIL